MPEGRPGGPGKADLFRLHPVLRVGRQEFPQAQKPAEKLGDDGGKGGAAHAGMKDADEDEVQDHVQHGAEDQVLEGVLPVAHRLHHAAETVVEHKSQASGKKGADIGGGELHHVLGSAHGLQHPGGEEHAEDRHEYARRQAEGHVGVDGLFQAVIVLGTEIAGDEHPGACRDAHEKADDQKDQGARGAHRGQSVVSQQIAHDQGVRCVVELLKQVSQKERSRESKDLARDGALRHAHGVLMHPAPPT